MKRIVKFIACALAASAMLLSFAACGSSETANSGSASTNMAKVGVIQYATHGSLDNCYQGFKEGLAEGGYVEGENLELFFKNANGETSTSDLIAKNFVSQKVDLIGAIATPAAMSAYGATQSGGKPPIVFTAISDPVSAGLVQSLESTGANITGSCDVLPLESQVKMIRAFYRMRKKLVCFIQPVNQIQYHTFQS